MLAREDIDAVAVLTPSGLHPQHAIACARAGKHVIVEKPMALRLQDADDMIRACEVAGVKLFVDVVSVHARCSTALVKIETEDSAVATLRFPNGAFGLVEATTATRPADLEGSISILGERGAVEVGGFATRSSIGVSSMSCRPTGRSSRNSLSIRRMYMALDIRPTISTWWSVLGIAEPRWWMVWKAGKVWS